MSLISVNEALNLLLAKFSSVKTEDMLLEKAAGRVLSRNIKSNVDLPLFTNSSMDGFAVRAEDLHEAKPDNPIELRIVEDIPAGKYPVREVGKKQASRIMTGAPLPNGADTVVPVEDTDQYELESLHGAALPERIKVFRSLERGDYLRQKGEDVKSNEIVLDANHQLRPQDVGLLAMLGIAQVPVFCHPRIAILSTGDELVPLNVPLELGKIHDSNAYSLSGLITRDGGEAIYLGIIPDREQAVREALNQAVNINADLILSSAGVSVGAFDYVKKVVQSEGSLDLWRVNMRPGKPIAFGNYRGTQFIGLPGNPVSAFVGYEVFVRPVIRKLAGYGEFPRRSEKVKIVENISSDGRESYLRALVEEKDGVKEARLTGHQGSGNLLSLVQANALLIIPSGVKSLPSGEIVDAWMINSTW
ncbi:MAG: molybdopterin molybdotransferase MoeA [Chloroflexota bacterium]|nr:MAG: molybdopterin molybdotransferase MoeA [Chloroflexota bacterium]